MRPPAARAASYRPRPRVARVRFLANSTSVRNLYYGGEDVYLAEVELREERDTASKAFLACLLDDYQAYLGPISPEILKATNGRELRLLRDSSCDISFADMLLRTAPGDPMAIVPVKLEYRPEMPGPVEPEQILPCYRIVR
jgi:hypothetical protein